MGKWIASLVAIALVGGFVVRYIADATGSVVQGIADSISEQSR